MNPIQTTPPQNPDVDEAGHDDPLVSQIDLVHAWRRFPSIDPSLPAELLPARWSGLNAARLFTTLHARWEALVPRDDLDAILSVASPQARLAFGLAAFATAATARAR